MSWLTKLFKPETKRVLDTTTTAERVLCFPANLLDELGRFQGFIYDLATATAYRDLLLNKDALFYVDRAEAEQDPSLKQLIAYAVIRRFQHVLCYTRGKKGGESRLHDLKSIGFGGHINPIDGDTGSDETYNNAFVRELKEELNFHASHALENQRVVGLINDDSNAVGQVHFGIVHEVQVSNSNYDMRDPAIKDAVFVHPNVARKNIDQYEPWSKLIIESYL